MEYDMTGEQRKIIDEFHEKSIQLIYKRSRAIKMGKDGMAEYEEIVAVETARKAYEASLKLEKAQNL